MTNNKNNRILVVDDEASQRDLLHLVLTDEGYAVETASSGEEAVQKVEDGFYQLVIMDMNMGGMNGLEALKRIKDISSAVQVLIVTAYASVDTAVDAMRSGALNYLTKPIDLGELKVQVEKTLQFSHLVAENESLKAQVTGAFEATQIIGKSSRILELFDTLRMVAPTEATVLILGESGTGKELVADAVHLNSPRKKGPLVKVNCAALPETLLESELFGHEKGSFTGAVARREGRFKLADGGTLFLDEIAEMSLLLQAKLLRVIQSRSFERVGGTETISSDVRLIVATNRDLEDEVREKRFREDLFYRLNVVPVTLPPLRERREDIPLLADHFLSVIAERNGKLIRGFSPQAMDLLVRNKWKGNVRELENVVERAVIMARGDVIQPGDLPGHITEEGSAPSSGIIPGRPLSDLEREAILSTLEMTGGNRTESAKLLGISRRTLQYKLKEFKIQ
ncbi:MAG: sigma-54 dependent transcriptional regulator [bacterium]|nr:sigma-54 dependent transcriptional regulator [bacterium]MDT8365936.1 sigma-54 dependent transcriptional regulator [bacterium]